MRRPRTSKPWSLSDQDAAERFDWFVEPEPMSGCHIWTGRINRDGYGEIDVRVNSTDEKRSRVKAYKAAWIISLGWIPRGSSVIHRCDNRLCVNVSHLRLGSHHENVLDMARKNRGTKSRHGYPYGVSPYRSRFVARVSLFKRRIHVGVFDTIEEAAMAAANTKRSMLNAAEGRK